MNDLRSCNWSLTINNFTEDDKCSVMNEPIKWGVWQIEKGKEGTPHIQGFVQLQRDQRPSYVKKMHSRAHWEVMESTPEKCRAYCQKLDTRISGPWEYGEFKTQGQRTDLKDVMNDIKSGVKNLLLWERYPSTMVRYHKSFDVYKTLLNVNRNWKTEVYVFWGKTG